MLFRNSRSTYDFLLVGLGNPGLSYEQTRHNAGFMAIDRFAEKHGCRFDKKGHDAVYGECRIGDKRILLAKPMTFMNLSGKAVASLSSYYKIPTESIIIMFDDISLDVGKIRLRRKGSSGGQKGMNDIIEMLGTEEIMRVKIGVGTKPHPDYDLKKWVLGKIPKENLEDFGTALDNAVSAVEMIITESIDKAMNKYSK